MDWKDRLMKDDYHEATAGLSYEELYQAFKKRFMEEVRAEYVESVGFSVKRFELELKDKHENQS